MTAQTSSRSSRISDFLAAVIQPLLPALLAGGAIRTLVTLSLALGLLSDGDPTYTILQAMGDAFFYFFPIFLAYSIAKLQGSSQTLAILVAAILVHPDLTALLTGGGASFLGISVKEAVYPTSVLPIFLLTLLLKPLERLAERITPTPLKAVGKPLLILFGIIPTALWVVGPAVSFVGDTLATGFHYLYQQADWVAVLLLSLWMPLLILLGLHHQVVDPADIGPWSVAVLSATLALGGLALATLRSRDQGARQVALGASISAIAGIAEPAAYGTALWGMPLLSASIASGIGGLVGSLTHLTTITEGAMSPIFALIHGATQDRTALVTLSLTLLIPLISGLGLGLLTRIPRPSGQPDRGQGKEEKQTLPAPPPVCSAPIAFTSPLSGRVIPLSAVEDPVFASGVMGQGCAILPDFGKVYAPCDGVVTAVKGGKNALSIHSKEGVQLFIHIGIDSAKPNPQHFDLCCRGGDSVKQGDLLLSFDMEALRKEQTDLTTPLLVVNMDRYDDLSLTCEVHVKAGDRLLTLNPKKV